MSKSIRNLEELRSRKKKMEQQIQHTEKQIFRSCHNAVDQAARLVISATAAGTFSYLLSSLLTQTGSVPEPTGKGSIGKENGVPLPDDNAKGQGSGDWFSLENIEKTLQLIRTGIDTFYQIQRGQNPFPHLFEPEPEWKDRTAYLGLNGGQGSASR